MDNRNNMDGFNDQREELSENSESSEGEQNSSILDDKTGEFRKKGFSSSYRDDSKSISDDYEKMLQEQEEFLKSLDEHFGTFTNDGNPVEDIPTLEELLDSFVMPTIPEDNPVDIPAFNTVQEDENVVVMPDIQNEETADAQQGENEEMPEIHAEEPVEQETVDNEDLLTPYAPEVAVDAADLGDTIEFRPGEVSEETAGILDEIDLSELPESEDYRELVVGEPQQPAEDEWVAGSDEHHEEPATEEPS